MASDGKQPELQGRQHRRALRTLGVRWTVIGTMATLVFLLIDYREMLRFAVIWTCIGAVMLVLDLLAKKRATGVRSPSHPLPPPGASQESPSPSTPLRPPES